MSILLHALWRLAMVGVGFAFALVAAGAVAVLGLGLLPAVDGAVAPDAAEVALFFARILRGGLLIGPFFATIAPAWLVAAGLAELFGVRALLAHLAVAAVVAVVGLLAARPLAGPGLIQVVAAGGLAAGFVFWLTAARDAGPGLLAAARARAAGDPRATPGPGPRSGGGDADR